MIKVQQYAKHWFKCILTYGIFVGSNRHRSPSLQTIQPGCRVAGKLPQVTGLNDNTNTSAVALKLELQTKAKVSVNSSRSRCFIFILLAVYLFLIKLNLGQLFATLCTLFTGDPVQPQYDLSILTRFAVMVLPFLL